ncbi:hypothetical protein IE4872_PA00076 (plasmid) [Rhizobium gallicum]|uniref:Uncharacterized protein n=1 Tax=Rhizobium gallicum TaxID=56730 RepID=A0A1L5NPK3_9HYPH|nr:hypothetical protein IE4872_PA00076 [Rhizobium gallicum]
MPCATDNSSSGTICLRGQIPTVKHTLSDEQFAAHKSQGSQRLKITNFVYIIWLFCALL